MKHIKFIALILSVLAIFCCSCSESKEEPTRQKRVRTVDLNYNQYSLKYERDYVVRIRMVDSLYRIGDTIGISIDNMVKRALIIE